MIEAFAEGCAMLEAILIILLVTGLCGFVGGSVAGWMFSYRGRKA